MYCNILGGDVGKVEHRTTKGQCTEPELFVRQSNEENVEKSKGRGWIFRGEKRKCQEELRRKKDTK